MATAQRVDPRLSRQMAEAGDDGLVQAILIIGDANDPANQPDDAGLAEQIVAEASARARQPPVRVYYLPRANAAILTARVCYLHAALDDRRVILVSATTVDIFPWE